MFLAQSKVFSTSIQLLEHQCGQKYLLWGLQDVLGLFRWLAQLLTLTFAVFRKSQVLG